jgi:hypothetical protein
VGGCEEGEVCEGEGDREGCAVKWGSAGARDCERECVEDVSDARSMVGSPSGLEPFAIPWASSRQTLRETCRMG